MKVTFIRPNLYEGRSRDAMEPLAFAILQGLTPPDVEAAFYDERLEPIPFDEPTDLAALTVETYTARRAYSIAAEFRRRGVPVVMGGYHPTFLPEEALHHADAVVEGDAEGLWEQVVADARQGRLQRRYRRESFAPLGGSPPDRRVFQGKRYAPVTLVQYGRGCRYNCDFCSIRAFYGTSLRQRPVAEVADEVERQGRRHVFFVDDNIFVDVPKAKELFRALIPLRIRWSCQVSIDVAHDRELLALMEKSGCLTAVVGFESLQAESLAADEEGLEPAPRRLRDLHPRAAGRRHHDLRHLRLRLRLRPARLLRPHGRVRPAPPLLPGQLQPADAHARRPALPTASSARAA